jgi:branched-chain amino acid transport system substrate-binding protein
MRIAEYANYEDNPVENSIFTHMKKFIQFFSLLFCCILFLFFSSCDKSDSVKIGLNAELTGSVPVVGKSCVNAATMAADEINAAGGIAVGDKTLRVRLLVEDNEDKAESAAAVAQKFVSAGVVAMIGPNASRNAVPAATIAESNRLIMISPWSTNPKLTDKKKYIFRACFTDDFQGVVVAALIRKKLGLKKAAVLFDIASEYNKGIAEVFKSSFVKAGGEVVAFESYSTGDKDFTAQLSKIRSSGPEALFLPNYYNEAPLQIQQARRLGLSCPIVGSDSWGSEEILKLGGSEMNGLYFTAHYSPDMTTDKAKKFIADYRSRFGAKPDDVAALTYDSFCMLFESLKRAGSKQTKEVLEVLSKLSEFRGITGTMKFVPGSGSPVKSAVVILIKDGAFTYYDTIDPL